MKTCVVSFCVFILVAISSAWANRPAYKPDVMVLHIGGFTGGRYEVHFDGETLEYWVMKEGKLKYKKRRVTARDEDWAGFYKALDSAEVWTWKDDYIDRSMVDGTFWSAIIVYTFPERKILVTSGSNRYPPQFDEYLEAVRKLIGGRVFE